MVFFSKKLAVGLFLSSFFFLMQAQAETVKPTFVRSSAAVLDIPVGLTLSPDGTKIHFAKYKTGEFNLKAKANYAMYSKIPDYGAGIKLSATF